jgi:hypothetical protein
MNTQNVIVYQFDSNSKTTNGQPAAINAVQGAVQYVQGLGGGGVSLSWGFGAGYTDTSGVFKAANTKGVIIGASSGDALAEPQYPCLNSDVVCIGGSTINLDPKTGAYTGQVPWIENATAGTSSGYNFTIPMPDYQMAALQPLVSTNQVLPHLVVPAFSAVAYNVLGVMDNTYVNFGGTSASTPIAVGWMAAKNAASASSPIDRNRSLPDRAGTIGPGGSPTETIARAAVSTSDVLNRIWEAAASQASYQADFTNLPGNCGVQVNPTNGQSITLDVNAQNFSNCAGVDAPNGPGGLTVVTRGRRPVR